MAYLYRKKPVVIEAVQFTGNNDWEIAKFEQAAWHRAGDNLVIHTLEGNMVAQPGDWIIRGLQGELYPCKPDIFEQSYEPA